MTDHGLQDHYEDGRAGARESTVADGGKAPEPHPPANVLGLERRVLGTILTRLDEREELRHVSSTAVSVAVLWAVQEVLEDPVTALVVLERIVGRSACPTCDAREAAGLERICP